MMNKLVIGTDERRVLQSLAIRAARLPLNLEHMVDEVQTPDGLARYAAYMTGQTVALPVGYMACYSVEVGHPAGAMRHLAVHAEASDLLPSSSTVWAIALELGFEGSVRDCLFWIVDATRKMPMAVHLAQPVWQGAAVAESWMHALTTIH